MSIFGCLYKKVELKFIQLLTLQECDATSIFTSVVKYFDEIQVSLDKLIMFTSDGASVMLGCDNDVQAKLKSVVPHLIEFHCVAHREALSGSQVYQSVGYFVQIESMLHAIYSYFAHSSVRTERLKLVFNVLNKKIVRLQILESSPGTITRHSYKLKYRALPQHQCFMT